MGTRRRLIVAATTVAYVALLLFEIGAIGPITLICVLCVCASLDIAPAVLVWAALPATDSQTQEV